MKKIFIYIGSLSRESSTMRIIENILQKVVSLTDDNIVYEVVTGINYKIEECTSCNLCFDTGKCPLDNIDNMEEVKEKMINSDFIILASPVFAHNVSGSMKTFIDRISYWSHILKLVGLDSYVISTASSNGSEFVLDYLETFLTYLGTNVIGKENFNIGDRSLLDINRDALNQIENVSKQIIKSLQCNKKNSNNNLEEIFNTLKTNRLSLLNNKKFTQHADFNKKGFEFIYYKESGMGNYNSLQEYLDEL